MGDRPVTVRPAAKVLLVDQLDRVLLFRGGDPGTDVDETWWFPPGGGLDPGETVQQAARREVFEETGLQLDQLGPILFHRTKDIEFNGSRIRLEEDYFFVQVDHFELSTDGWTELERQVVVEHRWWTIDDLDATTDTVHPEGVAAVVAALIAD